MYELGAGKELKKMGSLVAQSKSILHGGKPEVHIMITSFNVCSGAVMVELPLLLFDFRIQDPEHRFVLR